MIPALCAADQRPYVPGPGGKNPGHRRLPNRRRRP